MAARDNLQRTYHDNGRKGLNVGSIKVYIPNNYDYYE